MMVLQNATYQVAFRMRLKDRVAIVTGSARGLGKVYAKALAKEGAKVVVADILEAQVKDTASEIEKMGGEVLAIKTDVSSERETENMAKSAMNKFGRIDVLINNAAMLAQKRKPFHEITVEEWDEIFSVNVRGTWLCTKAVFQYMKNQMYGKIVNVASGTFFAGIPMEAHYVSSKGGVIGFTRAICRELGKFNITINAIAPGLILTEGVKASTPDSAYESGAINARSLKRSETPNDLVGTIIFLSSSDSDFMTGQTIVVDGGRAMN